MSNTIIITWVRNGMALGTKWYGTRAHRYEMTRNLLPRSNSVYLLIDMADVPRWTDVVRKMTKRIYLIVFILLLICR